MSLSLVLKVNSVGDQVRFGGKHSHFGYCEIHSVFNNAVNFYIKRDTILSLVTRSVGGGPNNIVIDVDSLSFVKSIYMDKSKIVLNDSFICDIESSLQYNSDLFIVSKDLELFKKGLGKFEDILRKKAPALSAVFLIDKRRLNFFITPFEKNLAYSLELFSNEVLDGKLESVSRLKGLGFGLTPQGDDILDGFMIALLVYEKLTGANTGDIRKKIFNLSRGSNIISDTFLYYASLGLLYERVKTLVLSLFLNDPVIIENAVSKLLNIGETSGADISTGFLLMSKKLMQGGIKWL